MQASDLYFSRQAFKPMISNLNQQSSLNALTLQLKLKKCFKIAVAFRTKAHITKSWQPLIKAEKWFRKHQQFYTTQASWLLQKGNTTSGEEQRHPHISKKPQNTQIKNPAKTKHGQKGKLVQKHKTSNHTIKHSHTHHKRAIGKTGGCIFLIIAFAWITDPPMQQPPPHPNGK